MAVCFAAALFLQIGSTGPDLILCFLVIFSIIGEEKDVLPILAAAAALAADIAYGRFVGASAAAVLAVGFLLAAVTRQINGWNLRWVVLLTAGALAAENLMIWGIESWMGSPYHLTYMLRWMAGQLVFSIGASMAIYLLIDRGGRER